MNRRNDSKPRLSKAILEMKFMKRTKAKVENEIGEEEEHLMYCSEITDKMLHSNSNFIMEASYVPCGKLIDGRLSFGGMNPEIEQLQQMEAEEKRSAAVRQQATDVSNEEMSRFYYANKSLKDTKKTSNKPQPKDTKISDNNNTIPYVKRQSDGKISGKNKRQKVFKHSSNMLSKLSQF